MTNPATPIPNFSENRPSPIFRYLVVAFGLSCLIPAMVGIAEIARVWIRHRPVIAALADSAPDFTAFMRRRIDEGHPPRLRRWVALDSFPGPLVCAVLGAENARFFTMGTFDWTNQQLMVRRVLQGDWSRGGSGIPQQLARNLFLSPDRTVARKLREYVLAYQLSRALSKERQLELYLNVVELGDGVWGLASGSEHLFGKSAWELTPSELVLLATVLPAPSRGLTFPLSRARRAKLEVVARVLWRQLVFDDATYGATMARLNRTGEMVDRGLTPSQASALVTDEMGPEARLEAAGQARMPPRLRCDLDRRGVY